MPLTKGPNTWMIVDCNECGTELELTNEDKSKDLSDLCEELGWFYMAPAGDSEPDDIGSFLCPDCIDVEDESD